MSKPRPRDSEYSVPKFRSGSPQIGDVSEGFGPRPDPEAGAVVPPATDHSAVHSGRRAGVRGASGHGSMPGANPQTTGDPSHRSARPASYHNFSPDEIAAGHRKIGPADPSQPFGGRA